MANQRLGVEGMSCGHCVATIQKALGDLSGVRKVDVNLEKKEVSVEFDEVSIGIGAISAKIKEAGFDVLSL